MKKIINFSGTPKPIQTLNFMDQRENQGDDKPETERSEEDTSRYKSQYEEQHETKRKPNFASKSVFSMNPTLP